MIRYHLAGLLAAPVGTSREFIFTVSPVDAALDGVALADPLEGDVRLQRTNRGIWLEGTARGSVMRSCVRCLDPLRDEVRLELAEEFLPNVDLGTGSAIQHDATEAEVRRIDEHHEVDLWPVVLEELTLAEPAHPLCRPDCGGLCPVCGRSRDRDPCSCRVDDVDPRLAALANWQAPVPEGPAD